MHHLIPKHTLRFLKISRETRSFVRTGDRYFLFLASFRFVQLMARKTFKTIEADVDAGTHDDRLYNTAFEGWRASLRNRLLPLVRHETPLLASMQVTVNQF